jgi:hypothetical protein
MWELVETAAGSILAESNYERVFVAEAASAEDAQSLSAAAVSTARHETLGVAEGRICCVLVASSIIHGQASFEAAGALERFAEPLRAILRAV